MSKREFTKVSPNLWRSTRFRKLATSDAQLLYLYFLTCDHQNSTGCFRLPNGYACADLGWEEERYVNARECLVGGDMVSFDDGADLIYVHRWFKHSPPMNDKHAVGTFKLISEIESDDIREKVEAEFTEAERHRAQRAAASAANEGRRTSGANYRNGGF